MTPDTRPPLFHADGAAPVVLPPVGHYLLDPAQAVGEADATHTLLELELGCVECGAERLCG